MANESQSRTSRHDSKKGTAKKAPKPLKPKANEVLGVLF